jgi:hypothetical protein
MERWRWVVCERKDRTVVMSITWLVLSLCDVTLTSQLKLTRRRRAALHLRSEDRRAKK